MKTLLQNKIKFLILMFLALSLSGYSAPDTKSKSTTKVYKNEYRSHKKGCSSFKQQDYKKSNQHRNFQKRLNRANR